MIKCLNETHDYFQHALEKINASGHTALGPAAVISVAAAASKADGSRVIICTDGLSNIGIGNLHDLKKGSVSKQETDEFYDRLATFANTNGVTIDLISIEGAE